MFSNALLCLMWIILYAEGERCIGGGECSVGGYITPLSAPPRIAVDIDEVLFPWRELFCVYYNTVWASNYTIGLEDFASDTWEGFLHTTPVEKEALIDAFQASEMFAVSQQTPLAGSTEALLLFRKMGYSIVAVTSRAHTLRSYTVRLLETFFPGVFDAVVFGNNHALQGIKKTKGELCEELHCDYLIDDMVLHCNDVASYGVRAMLFGNYSWNSPSNEGLAALDKSVIRVGGWSEVVDWFSTELPTVTPAR